MLKRILIIGKRLAFTDFRNTGILTFFIKNICELKEIESFKINLKSLVVVQIITYHGLTYCRLGLS